MIFLVSLNQVDSFEHIGNIVNSPLLNAQLGHCLVEVEALIVSFDQKLDELLGQLHQSIILPALFSRCLVLQAHVIVLSRPWSGSPVPLGRVPFILRCLGRVSALLSSALLRRSEVHASILRGRYLNNSYIFVLWPRWLNCFLLLGLLPSLRSLISGLGMARAQGLLALFLFSGHMTIFRYIFFNLFSNFIFANFTNLILML